jgi:haloalkane dehalogenase
MNTGLSSQKLNVGDKFPAMSLTTTKGKELSIPVSGAKFTHVQFRRFSGCPICNKHIASLRAAANKLLEMGIYEVLFFHSTTSEVQSFHHDLPFEAIADPGKRFYRQVGAEQSYFASLHPSALWAGFVSSVKGRMGSKMTGGPFGLPAEFLVASDGRILAAKYGLHAYDQWSVDELLKLTVSTNTVHSEPTRSPGSAAGTWAGDKCYAEVLGRRMAYVERGAGNPIVFLHGNPTSSFLWRGVLPHVEAPGRRLIAPDLIGMGDSDKMPAGVEPDRYRFAGHARYLDAFMDQVVGTEPVTLVLHDWGGALGFDWAYRHQNRVLAIAYMETFVAPLTLDDLPKSFHSTLKAVRSPEGEVLVLEKNMFIEKMLPGVTQRKLSADEMAEYRRPFAEAGDGRWPTLQWPREVPLSGEPADVHQRIAAYSVWLRTARLPKLFVDAEPGVFITGRIRDLACSFANQQRVKVKGLHFVQEDSPDEVGQAIAAWINRFKATLSSAG